MSVHKLVTMREALESRDYFADLIGGPSWASWRVLLIAIMGEELTQPERAVFRELTGREHEPGERVQEFWGIIGRRGGKTQALSVLACYLATCVDHRSVLAAGERGTIPIIAAAREQAAQSFNFISGAFATVPNLGRLVTNQTNDVISLKTGVDISVRSASFRTIRGITAVAVICDEIAFWLSDEARANPDKEVLAALRPSLATTGGPLIAITSPYARRGEAYTTWKRHFGADGDPLILVAHAASKTMNPTLPQRVIDRAMEADPAAASAEYLAIFRTDIENFVSREVVDAAVFPDRRELAPISGTRYVAFVDPSGGSSDSMTLAISHGDKTTGRSVLDCVRERRPPFSPESVVTDFAETLKSYGVHRVTGDRYAGEWPRERFRVHGVTYDLAEHPKSDIYRDCLPLLNSGKIELLDNARLIAQLCGLERRTARGGRDSIDHPPGAHDDLANSVAGALLLASGKRHFVVTQAMLDRFAAPSARVAARRRASHFGTR